MTNPSNVWTQLSLPNPPAGAVPYVDTDNASIVTDVLNFNYFASAHELFAKYYQGDTLGTVAPLAGTIGEYLSAMVAGGTVGLTNATPANITSIIVTPGDWDIEGSVVVTPAGTTVMQYLQAGISLVSGVQASLGAIAAVGYGSVGLTGGNSNMLVTPVTRIAVTVATVIYLIAQSGFTTNTLTAGGFIRARRVR